MKMEVVIAQDQAMEFQPRIKSVWKESVERHDFWVKCRPQNLVTSEGENPVVRSIWRRLGAMTGRIRVFMGPWIAVTEESEYLCGLWIRDHGTFLKNVFRTVEKDDAELIVTVKHQGQEIGDHGFNLDLHWDSSRPRTAVKSEEDMCMIGRRHGQGNGFTELFENISSESFTVTMVLHFDD